MNQHILKIAILDLYAGEENQGMRCLKEIIESFSQNNKIQISLEIFEIRRTGNIPSLNFDVYISTGGPGSPLESINSDWEKNYFKWLDDILIFNQNHSVKKNIFFICHSFQIACRYFNVANVIKRRSTSFGVFPVHIVNKIEHTCFAGLNDPFYAVDNRDYQVITPDEEQLNLIGAKIIAIEKDRPHVPYERAIMAIQFNENMIGTQFHPEADSSGMTSYLSSGEKKKMVIENYGKEKWQSMIDQLNDPDKIMLTYSTILPNFLNQALQPILSAN